MMNEIRKTSKYRGMFFKVVQKQNVAFTFKVVY